MQGRGFRRAALVSKTADGEVRTRDPFLWLRAFGATLAVILLGLSPELKSKDPPFAKATNDGASHQPVTRGWILGMYGCTALDLRINQLALSTSGSTMKALVAARGGEKENGAVGEGWARAPSQSMVRRDLNVANEERGVNGCYCLATPRFSRNRVDVLSRGRPRGDMQSTDGIRLQTTRFPQTKKSATAGPEFLCDGQMKRHRAGESPAGVSVDTGRQSRPRPLVSGGNTETPNPPVIGQRWSRGFHRNSARGRWGLPVDRHRRHHAPLRRPRLHRFQLRRQSLQ